MRKLRIWAVISLIAGSAVAATVGGPAPVFEGRDSEGKTHKLSDFAGKHIVLEWTNPGCPFVGKHYKSGNMQKLQKEWTAKGVIWLTVSSAAPGKQGHNTPDWWNTYRSEQHMGSTAVLLDETGAIGRSYGAKTTPHCFVIDGAGQLIYDGAPDDKPSTDPGDNAATHNYISAALEESLAGKPISAPQTKPYGCGVKY